MNPLLHWLTSPEWTHVVGALLHSLWQGAIIALALAVLMRRMANPVTRYRCALVTLSLVIISGIVTWAVLNAPKSAVSVAIAIPVTETAIAPVATAALHPDSTDKIVALGRISPPPAPKYWIAWLAVVWMLGTVAMLLRAGIKVTGSRKPPPFLPTTPRRPPGHAGGRSPPRGRLRRDKFASPSRTNSLRPPSWA